MNKSTKQLLEENNRREKDLSPESQKVLTDIVAYLRGASTPILQQEQVRRDITEMLLEGEVRGQSAQTIIGTDYQAFCDEILAELPRRSAGQRTIYGLSVVSLCAAVLVAIWLGFGLFNALVLGPFTLWLPVKLGQLLGGALIIAFSYGLVEYVCRTSFEDRSPTKVQVVANKVRDESDEAFSRERIPEEDFLGFIHYNPDVIDADRHGKSPYDFSPQAVEEIRAIKAKMDASHS